MILPKPTQTYHITFSSKSKHGHTDVLGSSSQFIHFKAADQTDWRIIRRSTLTRASSTLSPSPQTCSHSPHLSPTISPSPLYLNIFLPQKGASHLRACWPSHQRRPTATLLRRRCLPCVTATHFSLCKLHVVFFLSSFFPCLGCHSPIQDCVY